ncbi:putative membrane-anchored protein [Acinetobacter calcoaceticus]|uniref:Putative membrane-anchored protein n=1 Tax=Acinetobacter calcoaceticus TaxID=471 RepID=A0A4R1Y0S2_ACICA|nr:putative membrane-anchored protein [Acinetobacter calcoaceticus]
MNNELKQALIKVPAVTALFWVTKILATTFGETAGDALSMSLNLGYLLSTLIFAVIFILFLVFQISSKSYKPALYWATIIASTTVGTTLADFVDRSLGIGYVGGSSILLALVLGTLLLWYKTEGSISPYTVNRPKVEIFYWLTITFSQTLGTALGDWSADTAGLGYVGGIILFSGLILLILALHYWTKVPKTLLFWAAFVLTRPLGAVVGDFLDKPLDHGGLNLSRFTASFVLLLGICVFVYLSNKICDRQLSTHTS